MLIIGSHVNFGKDQLMGCVKQALEFGANTFMFYPESTTFKNINDDYSNEAYKIMKNKIELENIVCHAPFTINLANNKDINKYKLSIEFLISEVKKCHKLGVKTLVLHPGSSVGIDRITAIRNVIYALNLVLESDNDVVIALETMAGKGTEIGSTIEELKMIIDGIEKKELIGVCMDTCHLNDAGIDISRFDEYLDDFDAKIGLNKVKVIHINDSKNEIGSHKDRHEVIGYGTIGFDSLLSVVYNTRLENIPKILETPYIGNTDESKDRLYPPYKFEIESLRSKSFNEHLKDKIREYYNN